MRLTVVAAEPVIQLEMTPREAHILRALVGGVECVEGCEASRVIARAWASLEYFDTGFENKNELEDSYSTFFAGSVRCR